MGGAASSQQSGMTKAEIAERDKIRRLMTNREMGLEALIEHYQPPSFPVEPMVTTKTVDICARSWEVIKHQERKGVSGVVYFYDEFYKRLFDRSEAFNSFFSGDMKKKGAVLIRILDFLTTIDISREELFQKKMEGLAKVHSKRNIRPWQYSCFIEVLLVTISFVLEEKATYEVATAWTNLAALSLRNLLPGAIKGSIVSTESNQNAFSSDLDEDEVEEDSIVSTESNQNAFSGDLDEDEVEELASQTSACSFSTGRRTTARSSSVASTRGVSSARNKEGGEQQDVLVGGRESSQKAEAEVPAMEMLKAA